ncbi:unnamed protein product [Vitrella brassicaformis CCMP3155]|uniref:Protein kinase domain-containing protein n=1 Tax=Vitrella brassicaformis (strain CCMP3155) TaxID=1169540 RepID=A0A0G4H020_VITBC|nr:unnamed protein product [Vitrella brassicaformis CCMP3155]|eukprot:CEM36897.1 unnamed protein product [Vitrella brassicaformis CCMP3155]
MSMNSVTDVDSGNDGNNCCCPRCKGSEILLAITQDHFKWLVHLIALRASCFPSSHTVLAQLVEGLNRGVEQEFVRHALIDVIRRLLDFADPAAENEDDKAYRDCLKNLGGFLSAISWGLGTPVAASQISWETVLKEAYERGTLTVVLPMVLAYFSRKTHTDMTHLLPVLPLLMELFHAEGLAMQLKLGILVATDKIPAENLPRPLVLDQLSTPPATRDFKRRQPTASEGGSDNIHSPDPHKLLQPTKPPDAINLSKLSHPNIISCEGMMLNNGVTALFMPYIHGRSLDKMVTKHLPTSFYLHIAKQILSALAYMHSQQCVHRDIKPDYILVEDGTNKVYCPPWPMTNRSMSSSAEPTSTPCSLTTSAQGLCTTSPTHGLAGELRQGGA